MPTFTIDRLWPEPALGLDLAEAMASFEPPAAHDHRPSLAINMVTTIDGRAQLRGTAEGLGSRADRALMRLYRASFDAVASGAGTLRQTGIWLGVGDELIARRVALGKRPHPVGVVIAGSGPIPLDAGWFASDEPRILIVGAGSPVREAPPSTELLRAPDTRPSGSWVLERLAERGIGSVLLEGGPTVNAPFVAERLLDELYWTIGPQLTGTAALTMVVPHVDDADAHPWHASLSSVMRHGDELMLRYRFDPA
jgi:riboflavin biosynthesis pyrimidine reductase